MTEPPIFTWLQASSSVTALLGSGDAMRAYSAEIPQGTQRPMLRWTLISGDPQNYLSGRPDMDRTRYQFDCYADDRLTARQLETAVIAALELYGYQSSYNPEGRDPDTRIYTRSVDFEFWTPRA